MITNTKSIVLDVGEQTLSESISAKQYDVNSRFINLTIKNNGEMIVLTEDSTVVFNVRRSDGESKRFIGDIQANGSVNVPLDLWALTKAGAMQCDLSIIEDADAKLSTFAFPVQVEKASYNPKTLVNAGNYDVLMKIVTDYDEIKKIIDGGGGGGASIVSSEDVVVVGAGDGKIKLNLSSEVKAKLDQPMKRKTVVLEASGWNLNSESGHYEYTVTDSDITYDHYMDCALDLANQAKIGGCGIESFNGYYKLYATEKPTEAVTIHVVFILTEEVK